MFGKIRFFSILSFILCTVSLIISPLAQAGDIPRFNQVLMDGLAAKARTEGGVRVLVKLKVPNVEGLMAQSTGFKVVQPGQSNPAGAAMADMTLRMAVTGAAQDVLQNLPAQTYQVNHTFDVIPFVALEVDEAGLSALQNDPNVIGFEEDRPVPPLALEPKAPLLDPFLDAGGLGGSDAPLLSGTIGIIGTPGVWAEGYTGNGWYVAILDTGIRKTHQMFQGKNILEACYSARANCPGGLTTKVGPGSAVHLSSSLSGYDHGTHVAGIAAGNSGSLYGAAKDAGIISVQVFSQFTPAECGNANGCVMAYTSDQLAGLTYVYSLRGTYSIGAVNMSLGGGQYSAACDSDSRKAMIDLLKGANIATVIATGNDGWCGSVSAPGCISSAVSVGASTDGDVEAGYSNWHATLQDLFAPGSAVYSSTGASDASYGSWNGTSMATPHVAGTFVLMRQKNPAATVDQILAALRGTGTPISAGCPASVSTPRIRVDLAMGQVGAGYQLMLTKTGTGSGTVTASTGGLTCGGDCMTFLNNGTTVTLTAAPDPGFALSRWEGVYCPGNGDCTFTIDSTINVTAVFDADADSDGISNAVENAGPNGGDGDGSGTADSLENNVATFINHANRYVVMAAPVGTTLSNVSSQGSPSSNDAPGGVSFATGFYDFILDGATPGDPVDITLYLPPDTGLYTYYKYGPTPDNHANHWYEFMFDGTVGAEIAHGSDWTQIVLHFVDGGRGDDDLAANGTIVDVGGPAEVAPVTVAPAPVEGGGGGGGGGCFVTSAW